ncbi:MAG: hypothetical protein ACR2H3_14690 [Acidimicrobiales bacterium]
MLADVRSRWAGMAGRIGMGFAVVGFFVILLAWNGAAGLDYAQGQLPYLISGGAGGMGLVFLGGSLLVAESNRRDRAALEDKLQDLIAAVERMSAGAALAGASVAGGASSTAGAAGPIVVAGRSSFHDTTCHLVENRPDSAQMSRDQAESAGLKPCRVCNP